MKLIIDISEEDYEFVKTCGNPRIHGFKAIQNGIPLDSVKAEIKGMEYHMIDCDVLVSQEEVLDILDNIGKAESEVKPNE